MMALGAAGTGLSRRERSVSVSALAFTTALEGGGLPDIPEFEMDTLGTGFQKEFADDPITGSPFTVVGTATRRVLGRLVQSTDFYDSYFDLTRSLKFRFDVKLPISQAPISVGLGGGYERETDQKYRSSYLVISKSYASHRETLPVDSQFKGASADTTSPLGMLATGAFTDFALTYGSQYLAGLDYGMSAHLIIEISTKNDTLKKALQAKGGVESSWVALNAELVKSTLQEGSTSGIKIQLESVGFSADFPPIIITSQDSPEQINAKWEELQTQIKKFSGTFKAAIDAVKPADASLPVIKRHYLPYNRSILIVLPAERRAAYLKFLADQEVRMHDYTDLLARYALLKTKVESVLNTFEGSDSAMPYTNNLRTRLANLNAAAKHFKLCLLEDSEEGFKRKKNDNEALLKTSATEILRVIHQLRALKLIHADYPVRLRTITGQSLSFQKESGNIYLVTREDAESDLQFSSQIGLKFFNRNDPIKIFYQDEKTFRYLVSSQSFPPLAIYVKARQPGSKDEKADGSLIWYICPPPGTEPVSASMTTAASASAQSTGAVQSPEFSFEDTFALSCTYNKQVYYLSATIKSHGTDYFVCETKKTPLSFQAFPCDQSLSADLARLIGVLAHTFNIDSAELSREDSFGDAGPLSNAALEGLAREDTPAASINP